MVKTIYRCEWSGCNNESENYKEIERCETQGFTGPNIRSGFIVRYDSSPPQFKKFNCKFWLQELHIFYEQETKGHHRKYKSYGFQKYDLEKAINETESFCPQLLKTDSHMLNHYMENKDYRLLTDKQFKEIRDLFLSSPKLEDWLSCRRIKELYRIHSFFKRKK